MKKIAVFASGGGTNFQALIDAAKNGELNADIKLLVCDKPEAYSIERAKKANIPYFAFKARDFASKDEYENEIIHLLNKLDIEFIVLAGYMRLIGPILLSAFDGKIVNIHPSLLPAFPGKDAIGQAFEANVSVSGVTVHFVDAGMDTGPIIAQQSFEISKTETKESFEAKIHEIEHKLYPSVLQKLFSGAHE
ncbi:phosphoribosylglycinamide formyltransferase [Bacillus sp. FJAT-29790]|uniref:phosphoribosylglycinamide formyltransferase n=1 Tax=Bacillus sp. FJAT-29790 TaxID=1895002 RepID=UPI001C24F4C2|nr:phosphoribosylglycinamide formyltransferase [Bacillus sp. FJAT-29790]MBU8880285.1 phosphoribosylglycinamide formyltransferase [Bacillus sp. FJAT-29790]